MKLRKKHFWMSHKYIRKDQKKVSKDVLSRAIMDTRTKTHTQRNLLLFSIVFSSICFTETIVVCGSKFSSLFLFRIVKQVWDHVTQNVTLSRDLENKQWINRIQVPWKLGTLKHQKNYSPPQEIKKQVFLPNIYEKVDDIKQIFINII